MAVLNPLVGILGYISLWFAGFLFSGFFLPEDDVPWPLKVRYNQYCRGREYCVCVGGGRAAGERWGYNV